jgi:hypothetical protein
MNLALACPQFPIGTKRHKVPINIPSTTITQQKPTAVGAGLAKNPNS